ncbi:MAG TPA: glycolate oxidase subunit GlcF [Stellaceae bacterium]|nr:glycolate oxidase subunit GlcF [Stellaceae bacterium]
MQTHFTPEQLLDPDLQVAEGILRKCVHCGFCTATCPTYLELGDELDSPRGRIVLIKDMLERDRSPSAAVVQHIDRCLSCLGCVTTCPSGVNYMHLIDQARAHVEERYRRPAFDRLLRRTLAIVLPRPALFRWALLAAWQLRWLGGQIGGPVGAMLRMAPAQLQPPSPVDRPQIFPAEGERRMRVALLAGCAQQVVAPQINEATIRLLTRHGCEVVVAAGAGCCGALVHHLGMSDPALAFARANVDAWIREIESGGLDAIVANASGCGTMLKDYGFILRTDPEYVEKAARVAALSRDVSEIVAGLGLRTPVIEPGITVAYHSACSLQHGQRIEREPKALLAAAGFIVRDVPEGHICCGSAGTYNLLQPEIANRLKRRKLANIAATGAGIVAAGNIGCISQLAAEATMPIVHTVELLDWATGGPNPFPGG